MLDRFRRLLVAAFQPLRRGFARTIALLASPFKRIGSWYLRRGWILKAIVGAILVGVVGLYAYFFWSTQRWAGFNPDYAAAYELTAGEDGSTASPMGTGSAAVAV